jgi:hypothetical protein
MNAAQRGAGVRRASGHPGAPSAGAKGARPHGARPAGAPSSGRFRPRGSRRRPS